MDGGERRLLGGTQLMGRWLEQRLPAELLGKFQIHLSRFAAADPDRIQIFWTHEHVAPTDPELAHLADGGWRKFHRIVFVSNWQAQAYISYFGIPWSRCLVLHNAIEPLAVGADRFDPLPAGRPIRLIYTSVPWRGLTILCKVFNKICEEREDVELDVYSSFKLYGWDDPPQYLDLFDALQRNARARYHGAVPNQQVREALASSHVFAYPSVWPETSCLCLMEAMSAGLACVHPNYGALYETAADTTMMYQWQEHPATHAAVFHQALTTAINAVRNGDKEFLSRLASQKSYADEHYNWERRAAQWEEFLRSIAHLPPGG
jgi:glycosyltransferase involved in cell wall biosynthesis